MRLSLTQPQFKKLIQESIKEVLKENSYREEKNRQKLTEEKLKQTISKTVRKVIKEEFDLDDFGLPDDWYHSAAERAAASDIGQFRKDIMRQENTFGTDEMPPGVTTQYPLFDEDGEQITHDDRNYLKGTRKVRYNDIRKKNNTVPVK